MYPRKSVRSSRRGRASRPENPLYNPCRQRAEQPATLLALPPGTKTASPSPRRSGTDDQHHGGEQRCRLRLEPSRVPWPPEPAETGPPENPRSPFRTASVPERKPARGRAHPVKAPPSVRRFQSGLHSAFRLPLCSPDRGGRGYFPAARGIRRAAVHTCCWPESRACLPSCPPETLNNRVR